VKTFNHLYEQIFQFENLLLAAKKATHGKSLRSDVLSFNYRLEESLVKLQEELSTGSYRPGPYRAFYIFDPKKRMISAAPFRDRVVHHALCNVVEPLFDRRFICDSYANRLGKGTHRCIRRLQSFMRKGRYVLKFDITKYFPSIDHEILKAEIRHFISDPQALWLMDLLIDNSNTQEFVRHYFQGDSLFTPLERRCGLPIGNQTSQFFANVYLNSLDHYIKEVLGCRYYVRYVDDVAIVGGDLGTLWHILAKIKMQLEKYRLKLNENKSQIRPVEKGIAFLGQVIFPQYRLLSEKNVKKFARKMKGFSSDFHNGNISWQKMNASVQSWLGHAKQANSFFLRKSIFGRFAFQVHHVSSDKTNFLAPRVL